MVFLDFHGTREVRGQCALIPCKAPKFLSRLYFSEHHSLFDVCATLHSSHMSNRRVFGRTTTDLSLLRAGAGAGITSSPITGPTQPPTTLPPSNETAEHDNARKQAKGMVQVHVMPYLTPHKVSILILIEYFCQHQAPQNDVQKLSQFLLNCIQVSLNVDKEHTHLLRLS